MDESLAWTIIILGIFLIIVGGVILEDAMDSPYEACIEECGWSSLDIRLECTNNCRFVDCKEIADKTGRSKE